MLKSFENFTVVKLRSENKCILILLQKKSLALDSVELSFIKV